MMTPINRRGAMSGKTLIAAAVAALLLAACAGAPVEPDGAAAVRNKLTQLQADPNLASRAPLAMQEADTAVRAAEQPQEDRELAAYRVYMADRRVEIARAQAETSLAEDQHAALRAQGASARLDARTHEVDAARDQAAMARADRAEQRVAADEARSEANAAHLDAASSEREAMELQRQIDVLQATRTDHGLVLTLGDVLFASGRADLKAGATSNLDKVVTFLNEYPDRTAAIEGYTDSSEGYNPRLSERRAESVKSYLTSQGINSLRLSASGGGGSDPVASSDSAAGRQQNRRVEVTISNPPIVLR
jgi:outer membrane protein OmpA-like peptidoglycan-associated protein